ncbi:MAG: hypothetical protein R3B06_19990 [Kofleriaceae bacterium]
MVFRSDHDAALARAKSLERELARASRRADAAEARAAAAEARMAGREPPAPADPSPLTSGPRRPAARYWPTGYRRAPRAWSDASPGVAFFVGVFVLVGLGGVGGLVYLMLGGAR